MHFFVEMAFLVVLEGKLRVILIISW